MDTVEQIHDRLFGGTKVLILGRSMTGAGQLLALLRRLQELLDRHTTTMTIEGATRWPPLADLRRLCIPADLVCSRLTTVPPDLLHAIHTTPASRTTVLYAPQNHHV